MSNDKSDATYHGHLDPNDPTTDAISIGDGIVVHNGEVKKIAAQRVPMPKGPGRYDLEMDPNTGETRWVKLATVTVQKPRSQRVAEVMGAVIGGAIVAAVALTGIRFLVLWLWGV